MLDVFFTVDVEVWCDGWTNIDEKFPSAFRQYVYGTTPRGDFGLPYQLKLLNQHGLTGVFFVEPLFSTRFGAQALAEIVGLVQESAQEVQLHMHTEWVDEATEPLLEAVHSKRQHLRYFNQAEQTTLIKTGAALLKQAGANGINAFRAGSFAFNRETLSALSANDIRFDSSYNASMFGPDSGVMPGVIVVEPIECDGVYEYPMTVYQDGSKSLRHAQLTACSYTELEGLLWQAVETGRNSFVILSHGSELMNPAKNKADEVVVNRFKKLCLLLDKNRDCFNVRGFQGLKPPVIQPQPAALTSPVWKTATRMLEQAYRRKFR